MYQVRPSKICATQRAFKDEVCRGRMDRMLQSIGVGEQDVLKISDADLPVVIRENGWSNARLRMGECGPHSVPAFVFNAFKTDGEPGPSVEEVMKTCPEGTPASLVASLLGRGGKMVHRANWALKTYDEVCRGRYQFDTVDGCLHGCQYCEGGKVAVIQLNLEEFVQGDVEPTVRANPWQKVFMFNSLRTDALCWEPEYGLCKLLVEYFAATNDRYFLIHTKSDNVDHLLDLGHRGHTIVLWSLTSHTVSREIEPASATTEERIEAARKCQEAGYTVRFKLKPVVPVRNWRAESREMIRMLFDKVAPDNVGMCMLAWMSADELKRAIDVSLLDPACVKAVEDTADLMKGKQAGPFPHATRVEVYSFLLDEIRRHDDSVPVFLCTETTEMWKEFAPRLGMNPSNYVCGCGPQCPPGTTLLDAVERPAEDV